MKKFDCTYYSCRELKCSDKLTCPILFSHKNAKTQTSFLASVENGSFNDKKKMIVRVYVSFFHDCIFSSFIFAKRMIWK